VNVRRWEGGTGGGGGGELHPLCWWASGEDREERVGLSTQVLFFLTPSCLIVHFSLGSWGERFAFRSFSVGLYLDLRVACIFGS